jgi:hypothetical protein
MPEHHEFGVGLQPLITRRSHRLAWLAAAMIPFGLVCLVAVAWFGGNRAENRVGPTAPSGTAAAARASNTTAETGSPNATSPPLSEPSAVPTPNVAARPERVAMADVGYEVATDPSAIGPPIAEPDGRVVVFRSGGWLAPDGIVAVGVGTPAQPARIFGSDGSVRVYGTTLAELERDFRLKSRDRVVSAAAIVVDGVPARLLAVESFPPEIRSVVLVVRDGRSYVIAAWGFSSLYPGNVTSAARSGLADFLRRFRFLNRAA